MCVHVCVNTRVCVYVSVSIRVCVRVHTCTGVRVNVCVPDDPGESRTKWDPSGRHSRGVVTSPRRALTRCGRGDSGPYR